ncbi:MAG: hypothetical protein MUC91_12330, partial [Verrucomicrobia bacterium]|nr:hypothetical protein [Verrucomicrobiota bacterium]
LSTFTWLATNNNLNVTGQSTTPVAGEVITNVLRNITSSDQTVIYAATPVSTYNCTGEVFTVSVTVYPEPVATNVTLTACSSVPLNYLLQSAVTNGVASKFLWVATNNNALVTGQSTTVRTNATLNDILTNKTAVAQPVIYRVTPISTAHDCTGKVFTLTVNVYPEPVATNVALTYCSRVPLNFNLQSAVTNTVTVSNFTWTSTSDANVSGATSGAGLFLTNLLVNTCAVDGTVTYQVTPTSFQGCTGKVFTVSVLVHPEPVGTNVVQTLCNGDPFVFSLQTAISNQVLSTFTWLASNNNTNVTGQTTNAQTSNTINDPLTNLTTNAQSVVYQVLPVSVADGCTGKLFTVTATIYPRPTATVLTETNYILLGDSTLLQVDLTGTAPWTVTWSDGVTSNNVASTPAYRSVSPTTTTVYSVTNLVDAHCTAQPGDLSGEATVDVLSPKLEIYLTNANQNVVVTWFGDAALLSATNLATTPIAWTFLTNGTAGVTNSWIDAIALPPTNTFYSLTNN